MKGEVGKAYSVSSESYSVKSQKFSCAVVQEGDWRQQLGVAYFKKIEEMIFNVFITKTSFTCLRRQQFKLL